MPKIDSNNDDALGETFKDHHDELYSHLDQDGELRMVDWADAIQFGGGEQHLAIPNRKGEHEMAHATTSGDALVSNGFLGVDMVRVEQGEGFVPHTHPGDHILIPVLGTSTITYDGKVYKSEAGSVYMIDGDVPHAVGAITDAAIMAVGAPHAPIDSDDRMEPVEYEEVSAEFDTMHCLICDIETESPTKLHDKDCNHCSCHDCFAPDDDHEHTMAEAHH